MRFARTPAAAALLPLEIARPPRTRRLAVAALLATTALVAAGGPAFATDVTVMGSNAGMGVPTFTNVDDNIVPFVTQTFQAKAGGMVTLRLTGADGDPNQLSDPLLQLHMSPFDPAMPSGSFIAFNDDSAVSRNSELTTMLPAATDHVFVATQFAVGPNPFSSGFSGLFTAGFSTVGAGNDVVLKVTAQDPGFIKPDGAVTVSGGNLVLDIGVGANQLLSGVVADGAAGPGGLVKTGAGILALTGANTFTGGFAQNGGTTQIGSNTALGNGAVTFTAGTIQAVANNLTLANAITFNGTTADSFLDANGNTVTFAGDLSGAGGVTVQDSTFNGSIVQLGNTNANFAGRIAVAAASTLQFIGPSTAGKAAITNNLGVVNFRDSSSAGSATLNNINGGLIQFFGSSTAAGATITNDGSGTIFIDSSSAGSATLNNSNNGQIQFLGSSTAANATIQNINGSTTLFNQQSNAGGATITIADVNSGTFFAGTSSAANAKIANTNGGSIVFFDQTTAAGAVISNDGTGRIGTRVFGSQTSFAGTSSAGSASISNSNGGLTVFFAQSTAADATITTTGTGSATILVDQSSGGNARFITAAGGAVDISLLGVNPFNLATPLSVTGTTAGSIEGAGDFYLGGRSLTVGGNNLDTTVSGTIRDGSSPAALNRFPGVVVPNNSGGSLIKVGAGTLTLTGANTYTGATTINGGVLAVAAGGSLATSSVSATGGTLLANGALPNADITLNAGGVLAGSGLVKSFVAGAGSTVAPGNSVGTLPATGNATFMPGSTFAVELVPGTSNVDKVSVGGKATITGGTVALSLLPNNGASLVPVATFPILNADGGVTGQFDTVTSPSLLLLFPTLAYDANTVILTLNQKPGVLAGLAATPNQRAVGATFDGLPLLTSPLTLPLAFSSNADSVRFALDQLSGEVHASTAGVLLDDTRLARDAILARLRQVSAVDLLAKGGPTTGAIGGTDPALGLTLWTQALGSRADGKGDGNASSLTRSTAGVFGGADLALLDGTLRLGLAGGYTSTSVRTDHLRGSSDVDTGFAAAYLGAKLGGFALRGGVTGGFSSIDTTRDLTVPGYAGRLSSGSDARTLQGFAEVGYGIDLGKVGRGAIALEPFAGIALARFDRDAATERGTSIAALSIRSDDQSVAFSTVGLRGAATFALGDGLTATPRVSAAYQHASGDVRPSADLAFLAGGAPFTVSGTPLTKDALLFEAGVEFKLPNDAARLTVDYSGRVGDEVEEHAIKGGLNVRF